MPSATQSELGNFLAYDGDCPFCSRYAAWMEIQEVHGPMRLVNLRDDPELVEELNRRGLNVDDGMVLHYEGRFHHGEEAFHRVALMSTGSRALNRAVRFVFRSRTLSNLLYPVLVACRNVTLRALGRRKINDPHQS